MNLALNREYPDPDEAKLIEEMVKVAVERMKPQQGRIRRGQLLIKATGCDGGCLEYETMAFYSRQINRLGRNLDAITAGRGKAPTPSSRASPKRASKCCVVDLIT